MKTEELFELVVMLTAKNMALEEDLKAIEESYHKVVKKLHDERIEEMELEDEDDSDYYPSMEEEARDVLDEIERQDYEANCIHEKDVELNQKFNSINARLRGTNNRLTEFVHRVTDLEKQVSMFGLDHSELRYRVIELEEKEDNDGK